MSKNHSVDELASALLDVRKAYRILHGYHRRVIETTQIVVEQFPDARYYRTDLGVLPFTSRRNPFEKTYWSWDATPLVDVSFLFTNQPRDKEIESTHRPGDYLLDIRYVADSAFADWSQGGEPQPDRFCPAEQAASYLSLLLVMARKECRDVSWYDVWHEDEYPRSERAEARWGEGPYDSCYQRIYLEHLVDRTAVVNAAVGFRSLAVKESATGLSSSNPGAL